MLLSHTLPKRAVLERTKSELFYARDARETPTLLSQALPKRGGSGEWACARRTAATARTVCANTCFLTDIGNRTTLFRKQRRI